MGVLKSSKAVRDFSFSPDKRKRRNQHRRAAINLLRNGGVFNNFSAKGTTFNAVATWHLYNARYLGR